MAVCVIPVVSVISVVLVLVVRVVDVAVCGCCYQIRYFLILACTPLRLCRTQAAILVVVGKKMNKMWKEFARLNPGFTGKVGYIVGVIFILELLGMFSYVLLYIYG